MRVVSTTEAGDIDHFASRARHSHFRQRAAWSRQFASMRESFEQVVTRAERGVVGLSAVRVVRWPLFGGGKRFVDGGPVFDDVEGLNRHLADLRRHAADSRWLRVWPYVWQNDREAVQTVFQDHRFLPNGAERFYRYTGIVDLDVDVERLYANLSAPLRRQLRRAERLGVTVHRVDEHAADVDAFAALLSQTSREQGYRVPHAKQVARYLRQALAATDPASALFVARVNNELIAGVAIVGSGDCAIYEWGARVRGEKFDAYPATHRLHWEAIRWARSRGFAHYDFGGLSSSEALSDNDRFKLAFGCARRQLLGEFVLSGRTS